MESIGTDYAAMNPIGFHHVTIHWFSLLLRHSHPDQIPVFAPGRHVRHVGQGANKPGRQQASTRRIRQAFVSCEFSFGKIAKQVKKQVKNLYKNRICKQQGLGKYCTAVQCNCWYKQ